MSDQSIIKSFFKWILKAIIIIVLIPTCYYSYIYLKEFIQSQIHKDAANKVSISLVEKESNPKEVTFKVCNNSKNIRLEKIDFEVSGYFKNRSTAYKLNKDPSEMDPKEGSSWFGTDYILGPGECTSIYYEGKFHKFGRYEIRIIPHLLQYEKLN